jgi:Sec-independent protein secretion pathway component TatC
MTPRRAADLRSKDDDADDAGGGAMGFLEHLDELRKRLIRSCIAIAAGMAVAFLHRSHQLLRGTRPEG